VPLYIGDSPICLGDEYALRLVEHHQSVSKWVTNDGAATYCDVKGSLDGVTSRLNEAFERLINGRDQ
jgi:hypothetical protein